MSDRDTPPGTDDDVTSQLEALKRSVEHLAYEQHFLAKQLALLQSDMGRHIEESRKTAAAILQIAESQADVLRRVSIPSIPTPED